VIQPVDLVEKNRQQAEQIQQLLLRIDELVNSVALLKEENQELRDEIAVLKGQKPRPKIPPSSLEGSDRKDKGEDEEGKPKPKRGKHPRKKKKTVLKIDQEQIIQPQSIPKGAKFKGYKSYDVQDITLKPNNTRFLIAQSQLPDGTYLSGELPKGIHGHYGPELIS
jgi:hypothetical protein